MKKLLAGMLLLAAVPALAQIDKMKDFVTATVSTGYDSLATSITLTTGHGARLLDPASDGQFYLVWYNATNYPDVSSDPKREIVRVTARSGDVLTIVRGQAGTTAQTKNTAGRTYKVIQSILASNWNALKDTVARRLSPEDSVRIRAYTDKTLQDTALAHRTDLYRKSQAGLDSVALKNGIAAVYATLAQRGIDTTRIKVIIADTASTLRIDLYRKSQMGLDSVALKNGIAAVYATLAQRGIDTTRVKVIIADSAAAVRNHNHTLDGLSNVLTTGKSAGNALVWNGTNWVDSTASGVSALSALTDVDLTGASPGAVLKYNGTKWVDSTDATGAGGSITGSGTTGVLPVWSSGSTIGDSRLRHANSGVEVFQDDTPEIGFRAVGTPDSGAVGIDNGIFFRYRATTTMLSSLAPLASPTFTGTVTLPVGLTGTLRAASGVVSATASDTAGLASALAGKQAAGTYLIPSDSTNFRGFSNATYVLRADTASWLPTWADILILGYVKGSDSATYFMPRAQINTALDLKVTRSDTTTWLPTWSDVITWTQGGNILLNQLGDPGASKTFNLGAFGLTFTINNPTSPAIDINGTGVFTDDLLHVHQHTGNPGAGTGLLHLESVDADVTPLTSTGTNDTNAVFSGGKVFSDSSQTGALIVGTLSGTVRATAGRLTATASDTAGLAAALAGKQTSGTYLIPSDSTNFRTFTNKTLQDSISALRTDLARKSTLNDSASALRTDLARKSTLNDTSAALRGDLARKDALDDTLNTYKTKVEAGTGYAIVYVSPGADSLYRATLSGLTLSGGVLTASGGTFGGLTDVDTTGKVVGSTIKWNGTKWVDSTDNAGTGGTLDDLTDVITTGVSAGNYLRWNGTNWVDSTASAGSTTFGALTDVDTTGKVLGSTVKWNGTKWVDSTDNVGATTYFDTTWRATYGTNHKLWLNAARDSVKLVADYSEAQTRLSADTVLLYSARIGLGMATDTALFRPTYKYPDIYVGETDTLVFTAIRGVASGGSTTIKLQYHATIYSGSATDVNSTALTVTSTTTGDLATMGSPLVKVPPGSYVWLTVTACSTQPTYLSVQAHGYRIKKR